VLEELFVEVEQVMSGPLAEGYPALRWLPVPAHRLARSLKDKLWIKVELAAATLVPFYHVSNAHSLFIRLGSLKDDICETEGLQ
jgi:hypothetical protein